MVNTNRRRFLALSGASGFSALVSSCVRFPGSAALVAELDGNLNSASMHWTNLMLRTFRTQNVSPLIASRACAMAHFAGYLALTGDGLSILESQSRPPELIAEVVYGVAFSVALEEALGVSLLLNRRRYLSQFSDKSGVTESVKWANLQAARVIRWRTRDGAQEEFSDIYPSDYPKREGALSWAPTGPFYSATGGPSFATFARGYRPAWGVQKPWLIESADLFEAKPFPHFASSEFIRQFEKVKAFGQDTSSARTEEHNEIALFWEDGLMGITVVGHFQLIAMQLCAQRNLTLDEEAYFFTLLSFALADAGIVAWHNKYHFDIVRPETAIRFAESRFSNHASLRQDASWESFIPTPAFPSYISGHSIFGAASCGIMSALLGSDRVDITSPAPDLVNWPSQLKGVRRSYTSLKQIADENGISREYGGVHWEIDNLEGLRLGYAVSDAVIKRVRSR